MEGIGTDAGGVLEQAQELPGAGVKHHMLRSRQSAAHTRQLHDGPTGAGVELLCPRPHFAGIGDEVAKDIGLLPHRRRRQFTPLLPGQQ